MFASTQKNAIGPMAEGCKILRMTAVIIWSGGLDHKNEVS